MNYTGTYEKINIILDTIKIFLINLGALGILIKLNYKEKSLVRSLVTGALIIIPTILFIHMKTVINYLDSMIFMIIILSIIFVLITKRNIGYTLIMTILSLSISNAIFFLATFINSIPSIIFNVQNDVFSFALIIIVYFLLLYFMLKNRLLKNGFSFLNKKAQSELFDVVILNISTIILFMIEIFGYSDLIMTERTGRFVVILIIIMFLTIKKSFKVYYKEKLLYQHLDELNNDLLKKQQEIEKLEQENLNFSKRSHSLAHKQKSLEYKINQLIMNEETAEELEIRDRVRELSKELYQKPIAELEKTGITLIDDMLKFMQSECIKNNIDFDLQISGNIYHIINKIITTEQLEILIADHVKDAIIAVKHSDNVNKSILVRLGKIEECYGLYIYDSGIEFEKETLENLGKRPSTTHKDEGGTGMGFMNTFDTLKDCKGSLIIKEIGKPSKENFTKIIMIKFDNRNEFKVISYR